MGLYFVYLFIGCTILDASWGTGEELSMAIQSMAIRPMAIWKRWAKRALHRWDGKWFYMQSTDRDKIKIHVNRKFTCILNDTCNGQFIKTSLGLV